MRGAIGVVLLLALVPACRETLSIPSDCAVECGPGLTIRDTVLDAVVAGDSSYYGYTGWNDAPSLLLANGSDVGVAHGVISFEATPDSIETGGAKFGYTIDSVVVVLGLVNRDTLVSGSRLLVYRLPVGADSTMTLEDVESYFTPERLIDSVTIADSVHTGELRMVFAGDDLERVALPPEDGGRISLGIKLHADTTTALRIGSRLTGGRQPGFLTFATGEEGIPDPRTRSYDPVPLYSGFVRSLVPVADPDLLVVGGTPSARAIVRFAMPEAIRGRASILRATLLLTPDTPYHGLSFDRTGLDVRAVVADLGYRSPPTPIGNAGIIIPVDGTDRLEVEVNGIVGLWTQSALIAQLFYLSVTSEGASFTDPVFRSTRSAEGRPQLRITYVLPGTPERL